MLTLSYGYFKPETNDKGSVWFPALEDNFQRLNDHNHDGDNSSFLTPISITKMTGSIAVLDWTNDGGGNYSVVVTVPAAISGASSPFNDISYYNVVFRDATAGGTLGDVLLLGMERESATTFTVRSNQNIAVAILYT